ncbi:MAG TPA: ribonuclease Z [Bacteroidales bacterium]|nr:ribonuclease Z [Bacteroidales bacterium]
MSFKLTVLGCSSATPTLFRHSSAQILNVNERLFLIDCGEGAQMQMRRFKIKFQRIDHIFISHLHGDHYLGLVGFLFTLHLLGRKKELHIYADERLKDILDLQFNASETTLLYPLIYHEISDNEPAIIYEDDQISVQTIPLLHRIPTYGFLFKEIPRKRKIKNDILEKLSIPIQEYEKIKSGSDFLDVSTGKIYKNEELTINPPEPLSFAYCSDTGYSESYLPLINKVDLLYHEATFMHDKISHAREKYHCTSIDAANIALKASAAKLLIGHFSARYDDLTPLLEEAQSVFKNTLLAEEGLTYEI